MTSIYIINRDNLERGFRRLVEWLDAAGEHDIVVIDNASTWPPLLTYYDEKRLDLLRLHVNEGPYVFWKLRSHLVQHPNTRFIVTDPDVVPSADCPLDLIARMHQVMDKYGVSKVGPSLRIDNLPAHYTNQVEVITWEKQFWEAAVPEDGLYHAGIDTTFALYPPGAEVQPGGHQLRLAPPYSVEHVPWYEDSANPTEEHTYYHAHACRDWTHWR